MARSSDGPWWWEARGGEYATLDGRPGNLHTTDLAEARKQWHVLHAQADIETTQDRTAFAVIADAYLTHTQAHESPKTYSNYRYFLQTFLDHLNARQMATLSVADLKPYHLDQCVTWQQ